MSLCILFGDMNSVYMNMKEIVLSIISILFTVHDKFFEILFVENNKIELIAQKFSCRLEKGIATSQPTSTVVSSISYSREMVKERKRERE